MANQEVVCRYVEQLIADLRSDMFLAVSLDKIVEVLNDPEDPVTKEDVKTCLKRDDAVKIIEIDGKEVLWLWDSWYLYKLIDKVAELASSVGDVVITVERTSTSETKN